MDDSLSSNLMLCGVYIYDAENIGKDIVLWRRRTQTSTILMAATATWVLMEVYEFKFITVVCWLAMLLVASCFLWANMLRLLGK